MRKVRLLTFLGIAMSGIVMAQESYPSIVAPDGGTASSKTMRIDWTLGEPVVESAYANNQLYTQGFHQPSIKVKDVRGGMNQTLSTRSSGQSNYEITVVPNPVKTMLTVNVQGVTDDKLDILIYDGTGQRVIAENIANRMSTLQIDVSHLPPGLYVLKVFGPDKDLLNVFKISKT